MEIGLKSGYSHKACNVYRKNIKKQIIERLKKLGYSDEEMKERFNLGSELALAKEDYSNYLRANEDIARMQAQFTDKQQIDANIVNKQEQSLLDKYLLSPRLPVTSLITPKTEIE